MEEAAQLAIEGMKRGEGGPFGAVIVKDGAIVGRGRNQTFKLCDPTAHAEVQAIRNACKELNVLELAGAVMYCTGEPCPMCMSAIYWAMLDGVYFANTKEQSAQCGFDDAKLYQELKFSWKERALNMVHFPNEMAVEAFKIWEAKKADAIAAGGTI
jgi:tRNA(Arg) A34 adenosine deaminase TadA